LNTSREVYKRSVKSEKDLDKFLKNMTDFNQLFCDMMASGKDFGIILEVHGNKAGRLMHCRIRQDSYDRSHSKE
jgi:hypothetical protein